MSCHQVEMLHRAVRNFSTDLQVLISFSVPFTFDLYCCINILSPTCTTSQAISETIKDRTVLQIKTALQKKAYEEAGIQVQNSVSNNKIMQGEAH